MNESMDKSSDGEMLLRMLSDLHGITSEDYIETT